MEGRKEQKGKQEKERDNEGTHKDKKERWMIGKSQTEMPSNNFSQERDLPLTSPQKREIFIQQLFYYFYIIIYVIYGLKLI